MNIKYGTSEKQRNWNRAAVLSRLPERNKEQQAEYEYRIAVQNNYSATGNWPEDFIEPA